MAIEANRQICLGGSGRDTDNAVRRAEKGRMRSAAPSWPSFFFFFRSESVQFYKWFILVAPNACLARDSKNCDSTCMYLKISLYGGGRVSDYIGASHMNQEAFCPCPCDGVGAGVASP